MRLARAITDPIVTDRRLVPQALDRRLKVDNPMEGLEHNMTGESLLLANCNCKLILLGLVAKWLTPSKSLQLAASDLYSKEESRRWRWF